MNWRETCRDIDLTVTPEQAIAMDTLEWRGFTFCGNFGTENAIELLAGMDVSANGGFLYEWLRVRMGILVYE